MYLWKPCYQGRRSVIGCIGEGVAWKLQEKGCTMGKGSVKGCRRVYVYW